MEKHSDRFFAIWTNAPLEVASTTTSAANFSKLFCKWAKDTLAKGLDPDFGPFPANVYVFDFFSKTTDPNGMLQTQYRTSQGDSHPNGLATDLIAPQFVNEIFDAAIAYETGIRKTQNISQPMYNLKIYPNPARNFITVEFYDPSNTTNLIITTLNGPQVYSKTIKNLSSIMNIEHINLSGFSQGIYFIQIQSENNIETKKLIIQ
jgi:hypothetical protein